METEGNETFPNTSSQLLISRSQMSLVKGADSWEKGAESWENITISEICRQQIAALPKKAEIMPPYVLMMLSVPATIIILLTVFGNLLVLCFKARVGRTNTTLLVWNLGLTDFLVGVIVLPFGAFHLIYRKWIFGRFLCRVWIAADVTFCTCSVVITVMAIIWTFSSAILLTTVRWEQPACYDDSICFAGNEIRYLAHSVVLAFFLPASVTLSLYWRIYRLARRVLRTHERIAKTLGVVSCSFLFCWLPFFSLYLTSYCNSMLNPIIYSFTVKEFKRSALRMVFPAWVTLNRILPFLVRAPPENFASKISRHGQKSGGNQRESGVAAGGRGFRKAPNPACCTMTSPALEHSHAPSPACPFVVETEPGNRKSRPRSFVEYGKSKSGMLTSRVARQRRQTEPAVLVAERRTKLAHVNEEAAIIEEEEENLCSETNCLTTTLTVSRNPSTRTCTFNQQLSPLLERRSEGTTCGGSDIGTCCSESFFTPHELMSSSVPAGLGYDQTANGSCAGHASNCSVRVYCETKEASL